ncbi:MAG: UpxY family transcription antiterminator [Prevotella sp.]|nr:UpxY family transcription antiterminator [Prevotella sp.]
MERGGGEAPNSKLPMWYILRTFNCQELQVSNHLKRNGLPHFIPMTYKERFIDENTKPKRVLVPLIHNYIFIEKGESEQELKDALHECPFPNYVYQKQDSHHFYEVSDEEMTEFRLICDPSFNKALVADQSEIQARVGKDVVVVHGPFTGIHGKLLRIKGKHFLIKTIGDLSIKMHISRWYCKVEP